MEKEVWFDFCNDLGIGRSVIADGVSEMIAFEESLSAADSLPT